MRKLYLKAATLVGAACTAALGFGAVPAGAAVAHSVVTPQCSAVTGAQCISAFTQLYGPGNVINGANSGKVTLRIKSNGFTNEDLVLNWHGTVRQAERDGLIAKGSYAYVNYRNFQAGEFAFAPDGNNSHLCIGVASPSVAGEKVTKQPCGGSSKTLWVFDRNHGTGFCLAGPPTSCPVINGSDQNFSTPQALTALSPGGQLQVRPENLQGSVATDNQQWSFTLS
jgi:hypothetical protein